MLKNISIAKKLPALFAAMTTISVVSVGVMSYVQMSNTIESDAIAKVVAVEKSMGEALDKQFELIDADLRVLGNYNLTRDALVRLNAGFEILSKEGENPSRYLQNAYLTNSQYPVGSVIWLIKRMMTLTIQSFTQSIMICSAALWWNITTTMYFF